MKEQQHHFDLKDAKKYGVTEAILLYNLRYWLRKNKANGKIKDGRVWTFNSIKAWQELFPYLSERQIQYALQKLEKKNVIIIGNYNQKNFDRTKWYSINEKEFISCVEQNCQMDKADLSNGVSRFVKAIPDNKQDNKQDITETSSEHQIGSVEEPKKEEKFDLVKKIEQLSKDPKQHIRLIGYYLSKQREDYDLRYHTNESIGDLIKRHSRDAVILSKLSPDVVAKAIEDVRFDSKHGKEFEWKLSTVVKKLLK